MNIGNIGDERFRPGEPWVMPWEPREIRGAVRLVAITPSSDERTLRNLEDALADPIAAGEIEWLDPIVGAEASPSSG